MNNNTKKQIIDRASDAFARYGVTGTIMQPLAESLHVSKRTLYAYFPGKCLLPTACVRRACMTSLRAIRARTGPIDGFEALWRTAGCVYKLLTEPSPAFRAEFARVHCACMLFNECCRTPLLQFAKELILRVQSQGLISPKADLSQPFTLFGGPVAAAREVSPAWSLHKFFDRAFELRLSGICIGQGRERMKKREYQTTDK